MAVQGHFLSKAVRKKNLSMPQRDRWKALTASFDTCTSVPYNLWTAAIPLAECCGCICRFEVNDKARDPSTSALHFAVVGSAAVAAGIQNHPWLQSAVRTLMHTSLHPERVSNLVIARHGKSDVPLRLATAFAKLGCVDARFWDSLQPTLLQQHVLWSKVQLRGILEALEAIDAPCVLDLKKVLQVRAHTLTFVTRKRTNTPLFDVPE